MCGAVQAVVSVGGGPKVGAKALKGSSVQEVAEERACEWRSGAGAGDRGRGGYAHREPAFKSTCSTLDLLHVLHEATRGCPAARNDGHRHERDAMAVRTTRGGNVVMKVYSGL